MTSEWTHTSPTTFGINVASGSNRSEVGHLRPWLFGATLVLMDITFLCLGYPFDFWVVDDLLPFLLYGLSVSGLLAVSVGLVSRSLAIGSRFFVSVRYTPSSGIRMPVPWQQVIDLLVGMTPNSQQDIGEIGLRVDLVGQAS